MVEHRIRADVAVTEELDASLAAAPPDRAGPTPGSTGTDSATGNAIHTAEGARDYGYEGALVAGVLLFGWCVPSVLDELGPEWLTDGWAEVNFRRPVYSGAKLIVRVAPPAGDGRTGRTETAPGSAPAAVTLSVEDDLCVQGEVGRGRAPWSDQLADLPARRPDPALAPGDKPALQLGMGASDLRTLDATVSAEAARAFGRSQPQPLASFGSDRPLVHPAILARQMISLLGHSYDYGRPSIHVSTHLENRGPVPAGEPLALSGRLVRTYERRGHEYAVIDAALYGPGDGPLARLRHTNIFRVARRSSA